MKQTNAKRAAQSGQAMAEFLVSMTAVLSVLFLGIVMLGKFNDIRNRTLMGARYAAWERTVWSDNTVGKWLADDPATTEGWSYSYGSAGLSASKSDIEIQHEVVQRFMSTDSQTASDADRSVGQLPSSQPAMWRDYGGTPLLASAKDVTVSTGNGVDPSPSPVTSPLGTVRTAAGNTYAATLNFPTRTLRSGTLSISIGKSNPVLQALWPKDGPVPAFGGLNFTDTNVLMANTWVPDGKNSAKSLFSQAVPAANAVLVPWTYQGLQKYAPEITKLEFGRIQQDVVPANRLSP